MNWVGVGLGLIGLAALAKVLKAVWDVLSGNETLPPEVPLAEQFLEDDRTVAPVTVLAVRSFLKSGEEFISGEEMRKRAEEFHGNFGWEQTKYLQLHQEEIPHAWRHWQDHDRRRQSERCLVFPGTVLLNPVTKEEQVPVLCWREEHWERMDINPDLPYRMQPVVKRPARWDLRWLDLAGKWGQDTAFVIPSTGARALESD